MMKKIKAANIFILYFFHLYTYWRVYDIFGMDDCKCYILFRRRIKDIFRLLCFKYIY